MINNNHKQFIDIHSLRFRLWGSFAVFAVFIMILLWFLQIFFLHNYYEAMKEKETERIAYAIANSYGTENFPKVLELFSSSSDILIHIEDAEGNLISSDEQFFSSVLLSSEFNKLKKDFRKSPQASQSIYITPNSGSLRFFILAMPLESKNATPGNLFLIAPLYPLESAFHILIHQLIYVTAIALLFSFVMALFLADRISQPLRYLTQSAKLLAQGKFGTEFKSDYFTEIQDLASTLTYTSMRLEQVDAQQKSLLANVSHDLRTPLTMVKSYAEMIRDISGDDPQKRSQHLQVIIDEADRLNLLVTDILSLSRLKAGTAFIEKKSFSMKDATESVLQSFSILCEKESYNIIFEHDKDIFIKGDEGKIKQVISNLLLNAIKFCGDDRTVIVKFEKRGSRMHFSVTDHGSGIAEDEIDYIWDRYYKAANNVGRPTVGTGLGLAIVKEIVLLHGGLYGVQSSLDRGSTFWFEI